MNLLKIFLHQSCYFCNFFSAHKNKSLPVVASNICQTPAGGLVEGPGFQERINHMLDHDPSLRKSQFNNLNIMSSTSSRPTKLLPNPLVISATKIRQATRSESQQVATKHTVNHQTSKINGKSGSLHIDLTTPSIGENIDNIGNIRYNPFGSGKLLDLISTSPDKRTDSSQNITQISEKEPNIQINLNRSIISNKPTNDEVEHAVGIHASKFHSKLFFQYCVKNLETKQKTD